MLHGQDLTVIDILFVVEIEEVNDDKVLTGNEREKSAKQVLEPVVFEVEFIG
jgi:hypothetical protein